jgi:hypothetical protein
MEDQFAGVVDVREELVDPSSEPAGSRRPLPAKGRSRARPLYRVKPPVVAALIAIIPTTYMSEASVTGPRVRPRCYDSSPKRGREGP